MATVQRAMDCLARWCERNHINVNLAKTKVIKFRKGGRLARNDRLLLDGKEVEFVSKYEYLGVILSSRFSFAHHIENKVAKASSAIGALKHVGKLSLETAFSIFRMKIQPIIQYSLETLAPHLTFRDINEIGSRLGSFAKKVMCLKGSLDNLTLEVCGWNSLVTTLKEAGCNFDEEVWKKYKE